MKTFSINIAKAYTQSDWRGLPAHMHHALVTLDYGMSEDEASQSFAACKPPTRGQSFT